MINKSSPEFMFGQILERLDASDKIIDECKGQISKCTEAINRLPCSNNQRRIAGLEEWRKKQNNDSTFKSQATIKFKHALIVGLIIAGFSSGITFAISCIGG